MKILCLESGKVLEFVDGKIVNPCFILTLDAGKVFVQSVEESMVKIKTQNETVDIKEGKVQWSDGVLYADGKSYELCKSNKRKLTQKEKTRKRAKKLFHLEEDKREKIMGLFGVEDVQKEEKEEEKDPMERELSCDICSEIYFNALSILPCLHSFCSNCLSQWWKEKEGTRTCPTCRKKAISVSRDLKTRNFVDLYLEKNPQKRRSDNETFRRAEENLLQDDVLREQEQTEKLSIPDLSPDRCKECIIPGSDGFCCLKQPSQRHNPCVACLTNLPIRSEMIQLKSEGRQQTCDLCSNHFCAKYFQYEGKSPDCILKSLEEFTFSSIPPGSIQCNHFEQNILKEYLEKKNISLQDVWLECLEKLDSFDGMELYVTKNSSLWSSINVREVLSCRKCATDLFAWVLFYYRRDIDLKDLPEEIQHRENCWYGYNCRTQRYPLRSHDGRLNHLCIPTKGTTIRNQYMS